METTNNRPLFKDAKNYLIGALLLVTTGLIVFDRDKPESTGYVSEYESKIQSLQRKDSIKGARIKEIFKASTNRAKWDSLKLIAKDKEIGLLKAKAITQRKNIQPLIDSIPELKVFIQTQDSIILVTEAKVVELNAALASQTSFIKELQMIIIDKDKIQAQMFTACEQRLTNVEQTLERHDKRAKRTAKTLKIVAVVGLVAGFFVGNQ